MPTSSGNPLIITALGSTELPASGQPRSSLTGLQLKYPLEKLYMSGAAKRILVPCKFGAGGALTASTAYKEWLAVPRAALLIGLYLVLEVAPTVATSSLTVTANAVSMLSATYTINSATPVGVLNSIALSAVAAVSPSPAGLPYLTLSSGYPYPLLCTYTEGATTVKSTNVMLLAEFELDDFKG